MPSERDNERAFSIRPIGRSAIQQLSVGENDTARVLFSPGGNTTAPGASGAFYSAVWFSNPISAIEMKVDNAGALSMPAGTALAPGPGRWPVMSRFQVPSTRCMATASLVLRGPGDNYAEFFTSPRAGMQLCDSAGVGWRYVLNAGGTAFDTATSVTLAAQTAALGTPSFFRADGRTMIGSRTGIGGSFQVESYATAIHVKWVALGTVIVVQSPNAAWWGITPTVTTGVLAATSIVP
jgi:hypothetical protein